MQGQHRHENRHMSIGQHDVVPPQQHPVEQHGQQVHAANRYLGCNSMYHMLSIPLFISTSGFIPCFLHLTMNTMVDVIRKYIVSVDSLKVQVAGSSQKYMDTPIPSVPPVISLVVLFPFRIFSSSTLLQSSIVRPDSIHEAMNIVMKSKLVPVRYNSMNNR